MKFIILFGWTLIYVKSFMIFNTNKKQSYQAILFSRLFEREDIPYNRVNLEKIKGNKELNNTQNIVETVIISEDTQKIKETKEIEQCEIKQCEIEQCEITETNKKIRTGRSEDEDGKTNVWSLEPKMEIVEEKNNSLKILAVIIGTLSLTFQFYLLMTPFLSNLSEQ